MARPQSHPLYWVVALALFVVWSNSFIAISYLLGGESTAAKLDWLSLTVIRFLVAGLICAYYCLFLRRAESVRVIRLHWGRLFVCGFLIVPVYNFSLYYGQQHGVSAPIASLTTALVPLFVLLLSAGLLSERLLQRHIIGLGIAGAGLYFVATARGQALEIEYPALLGITALAPLGFSIYTIISKPLFGKVSPTLWSYLVMSVGTLMVLPWLPGRSWQQLHSLDFSGLMAVLYLALPATVFGLATWNWLLRHLPASRVGFTVFLNPPLTSLSKWVLAALLPGIFTFTVVPREWLGGLLTLLGMGVALGAWSTAIGSRAKNRP
jgi:drug/metabolite transporter (DMT)-like permease